MRVLCLFLLLPGCYYVTDKDWQDASDRDGDGYAGIALGGTDCDDGNRALHPGAEEECDGRDNDCDGVTDEEGAQDAPTWHPDADADGFGSADVSQAACTPPSGWIADGTDCDDTRLEVHPGAGETCDGTDEDCDGQADEDPTDPSPWYEDQDGDGWGTDASEVVSCDAPGAGWVARSGDCDDERAAVTPENTPLCATASAFVYGDEDKDQAGWSVATAGDLDGDGYADILVGGPTASEQGRVGLFWGPVSGIDHLSEPPTSLEAPSYASWLGSALAHGVFLEGSEAPTIAVGAPCSNTGVTAGGAVLLYDIADRSDTVEVALRLEGDVETAYAGGSIATLGDANGDGSDDLLVGQDQAGDEAAFIVLGPFASSARVRELGVSLGRTAAAGTGGWAVAGAGDWNGDGLADSAVGSPDFANPRDHTSGCVGPGLVSVVFGVSTWIAGAGAVGSVDLGSADVSIPGLEDAACFGWAVQSPGDVDEDGYDDLLVGAPWLNRDEGGAFVLFGPTTGTLDTAGAAGRLVSVGGGTHTGIEVDALPPSASSAGVVLVAAHYAEDQHGAVYGVPFDALAGRGAYDVARGTRIVGPEDGEESATDFGWSVSNAGDVDADGLPDLLIGAPRYGASSDAGWGAGAAYLVSGGVMGGGS